MRTQFDENCYLNQKAIKYEWWQKTEVIDLNKRKKNIRRFNVAGGRWQVADKWRTNADMEYIWMIENVTQMTSMSSESQTHFNIEIARIQKY